MKWGAVFASFIVDSKGGLWGASETEALKRVLLGPSETEALNGTLFGVSAMGVSCPDIPVSCCSLLLLLVSVSALAVLNSMQTDNNKTKTNSLYKAKILFMGRLKIIQIAATTPAIYKIDVN
ncbi:MAG: hypothetical protein ACRC5A_07495 [Enterobacteriaceae bacterium]